MNINFFYEFHLLLLFFIVSLIKTDILINYFYLIVDINIYFFKPVLN